MKKQMIGVTCCLLGMRLISIAHGDEQQLEAEGLLFEQTTRQTLEATKTKDSWGYYDFPRLSQKVFDRSVPHIAEYFSKHPDRLFALKLDALRTIDNLRDKAYQIDKAPKNYQDLLFNGNTHVALLKKQRESPDSLTDVEREQLKFAREYELDKAYHAYLEQCQLSLKNENSNTNSLSHLLNVLSEKISDEKLKNAIYPASESKH